MMKAQIISENDHKQNTISAANSNRNIAAQQTSLPADLDLSQVKRNDLCPCGSGKKFKTVTVNDIKNDY